MVTTISGTSAPTNPEEKGKLLDAIDRYLSINNAHHSGNVHLNANGKVYSGFLTHAAVVREFVVGEVKAAAKSAPKKAVSAAPPKAKRKR